MRPPFSSERPTARVLRRILGFLIVGSLASGLWAATASDETPISSRTAPTPALLQDPTITEGLSAEAKFDSKHALDCFLRADVAHPSNGYVLQKISRQYSDLTVDTSDVAEKKRLCVSALEYGRRAAELQPDNSVNILSLAICYGKLGLYSDTRTKIEYSRLVRQYAERALSLNPDYDYAHHVLGRWHYEVATLGPATRLIVKVIYGGFPPASTAEAVRHLQRAVELSPDLPSHRVELGFALLADGQKDAARVSFTKALELPMREKYDTEARQRATAALGKLR